MAERKIKVPCPRCEGRGIIPQYFYNKKGICFRCWGSGYIYMKLQEGETKEQAMKRVHEEEIAHLKAHPPKAGMPDSKQHHNPKYFEKTQSKIKVKGVEVEDKSFEELVKNHFEPVASFITIGERKKITEAKKEELAEMKAKLESDIKELVELANIQLEANDKITYNTRKKINKFNAMREMISAREKQLMASEKKFTLDDFEAMSSFVDGVTRELIKNADEKQLDELEAKTIKNAEEWVEMINKRLANGGTPSRTSMKSVETAKGVLKLIGDRREELKNKPVVNEEEKLLKESYQEAYNNTIKGKSSADKQDLNAILNYVLPRIAELESEIESGEDASFDNRESLARFNGIKDAVLKLYPNAPEAIATPKASDYSIEDIKEGKLPNPFPRFSEASEERTFRREMKEKITNEGDLETAKAYQTWVKNVIPDNNPRKTMYVSDAEFLVYKFEDEEYSAFVTEIMSEKGMIKGISPKDYTIEQLEYLISKLEEKAKEKEFFGKELRYFNSFLKDKKDDKKRTDFTNKYFPDGRVGDASEEELVTALNNISELGDAALENKMRDLIETVLERKRATAGIDKAKAEAKRLNDELNANRARIVSNRKFKNTPIAKKIEARVSKGFNTTKDVMAVGEIVVELFEKNISELVDKPYEEMAKSLRAYRESAELLDKLQAERDSAYRKMYDKRLKEEKREEAAYRYRTIQSEIDEARNDLYKYRTEAEKYSEAIGKVKKEAYLKTMNEIREMGGRFNISDSYKGKYEVQHERLQTDTAPIFPSSWIAASNLGELKLGKLYKGRAVHYREIGYVREDGTNNVIFESGELGLLANRNEWSGRESAYVHEMQHRMEYMNPILNDLMRKFYTEKTKGYKSKSLGGTMKGEYYKDTKGGWLSNYMGKYYHEWGAKDGDGEETRAWEIGTMSMEMIIFNNHVYDGKMLEFHSPDVYKFVMGVLAGA